MMKIKSQNYRFGEDTIFTDYCKAGNGWIIAGDAKIDGKYKILLLRLDENGRELWKKIYGNEDEYEAQTIIKSDGGYLIGGNAYGRATESGGEGWKAYMLLIDEMSEKLKEKRYVIGNNDVIYSMLYKKDMIWCMGESEKNGKSIFLMKLNNELELLNIREYGKYEDVLAGVLTPKFLVYSYRHSNRWFTMIIRIDANFNDVWEKQIPDVLVYSGMEMNGSLLIVGSRKDAGMLIKIDENDEIDVEFRDSTILSAEIYNGNIILGGNYREEPAIYILNNNLEIEDKFVDNFKGWYEKVFSASSKKVIALGYSSVGKEGTISIVERR